LLHLLLVEKVCHAFPVVKVKPFEIH
jgi:hypothetical protein